MMKKMDKKNDPSNVFLRNYKYDEWDTKMMKKEVNHS